MLIERWRHHSSGVSIPGMAVLGVVPGEERPAEGDGGGNVFEAPREAGVILQGLEERVVIADLGAGAGDPEVGEEMGHLLVIGAPRSECRVSTWAPISVAASAAFSRSATIQPTRSG